MNKIFENAKSKLKKKKGFSIVEILIVVFITGIFVSLSMMNTSNNAEEAKKVVAKADCRNILAAIVLYEADTGQTFTETTTPGSCDKLKGQAPSRTDNTKNVGPWMATCPSSNPWGKPYTYTKDTTKGMIVSTTDVDGKTISTEDLSK